MIDVAREMEKNDVHIPLLIGGATTSRVHTAVKVEKNYHLVLPYMVLDASRSVPVAGNLLSNKKLDFIKKIEKEYQILRDYHFKKKIKNLLKMKLERKIPINWETYK